MLNPEEIKKDFPIFGHFPSLIFADNASTTHKPNTVLSAISDYYEKNNSNIHRAVYDLGVKSDDIYKNTKKNILEYYDLNVASYKAIFTSGTTDGINKLARGIEHNLSKENNVIVSEMEHHSNLIPWQELCLRTGAELRIVSLTDNGDLDWDNFKDLIDNSTKIVSLVHVSNTLGTVNDLKKVREMLDAYNITFIVDAAQSAAFYGNEFREINADAFVFSAHKMFGPSGIGVVLAKENFLQSLTPFNYGGGMVNEVDKMQSTYRSDISRFEAGTPPLAQIAGFNASIKYLRSLNLNECKNHISELTQNLRQRLINENVSCLGNPKDPSGVLSVDFGSIHPHDAATFLNSKNIAVRAGHHCTQLIMKKYNIHSSVRFSFSIYNSKEEIDKIMEAIISMKTYFQ